MTDSQQLRESMWDLVYGLLSDEESKALIARIKCDPQAARLYAEVRLQADLVGQAARVEDSSIVLKGEKAGQPVAANRAKAAPSPHAVAGPKFKETYHRGATWLAGIAATALAALLAVGLLWPRQDQALLARNFLVTEVTTQRSLPAGVTNQIDLRTARIDSNGEPSEGCQATVELRLLDRAGQEQFHKSVQTNEIGLANVEIPGVALEPGIRLEIAQTAPAAKESDRDQAASASTVARSTRSVADQTVIAALPIEPEPQVAYFLIGEPAVEPGKSVPVSVWNFEAFSGKPAPPEPAAAVMEKLSETADQRIVQNSQSGVVNGIVQFKDNAPRQIAAQELYKQQARSETKISPDEPAADKAEPNLARKFQSYGFVAPAIEREQTNKRLQQAQQMGRQLRDESAKQNQRTIAAGKPIDVSLPAELLGKPVLAAAVCRGVTVATATASGTKTQSAIAGLGGKSDAGEIQLALPPEADGVIEVDLFDRSSSEETPVRRELVYREPLRKLQIELPDVKSRYAPGEAVQLTLRVRDEQGRVAASTRLGVRVWNESIVEQTGERPVMLADAVRSGAGEMVNVTRESVSQLSDQLALGLQRGGEELKAQVEGSQKALIADSEAQSAAPISLPEKIELASNRDAVKAAFQSAAAAAETRRQQVLETLGGAAIFGALAVLLLVGIMGVLRLTTSVRAIGPAILVAGASLLMGFSWLGWMPQATFIHRGVIALAPAVKATVQPPAAPKEDLANKSAAGATSGGATAAKGEVPTSPAPAAEPAAATAASTPQRVAGQLDKTAAGGAAGAADPRGGAPGPASMLSSAADAKQGESASAPAVRGRAEVALGQRAAKGVDAVERARGMPGLQQTAQGAARELRLESRAANQPAAAAAPAPAAPAAKPGEAAPAALYFNPDLVTDAEGRATIEFVMPTVDSNYRLLVDALGQGRIGSQEQLLTCGAAPATAK